MQSADLRLSLDESMQLPSPEFVSAEAIAREEVLSWRVRPEDDAVYFLSLVAGDIEVARAGAEAIDPVRWAEFAPVDDDTFYAYVAMELRSADSALMGMFDAPGLVVVPPVVYTSAETVQVTVLGTERMLSTVLEDVPDGITATVERVSDHARLGGSLAGRLTDRQFEALSVAQDLGYYAVPREGSLAAVAGALDVSESAASTLLRSAEQALVEAALVR